MRFQFKMKRCTYQLLFTFKALLRSEANCEKNVHSLLDYAVVAIRSSVAKFLKIAAASIGTFKNYKEIYPFKDINIR